MKTLVFCTSFADYPIFWEGRYLRWVNAIRAGGLEFDLALIIDDGSPLLPDWAPVIDGIDKAPNGDLAIFHFHARLNRQALLLYPGWARSFAFAGRYAERHGFDRVVYVESDAFLVSAKAVDWANTADGWEAPFCPRLKVPESAIQTIGASGMPEYLNICRTPYPHWAGHLAESWLPFTRIADELIGDRFGATSSDVPRDADWAAQMHIRYTPDKLWWIV